MPTKRKTKKAHLVESSLLLVAESLRQEKEDLPRPAVDVRSVAVGQDEIALVTASALSTPRTAAGRFVLLSDLHAHTWSAFAKGDGVDNSRLQSALRILEQSLAKARELQVPWVFAGDIVHTAGYALNTVLGALTDALLRYPDVVKLVTWGNHDARGVGGKISFGQTVLATLSKVVPRFTVLDPSLNAFPSFQYRDPNTGLTFSGAGYQPRGNLLEYAAPSDVGIYHQTVRGTQTPNGFVLEEGIPAAELTKRHRVVVVGHVHHWQYVGAYRPTELSGAMVLVPGSPEHQNFGDKGEHGWWVISVGQTEVIAEFIPGGSPEFRTVSSPSDVKNDGHFYRVSGGMAGEVLPDGAIAIAPVATTVQSRDVLHGARGDQALAVWLKVEPPEAALGDERYLAAGRALLGPHEVGNLRPLKLTQVKLHNFCSYADQTVDIRPGTWLVIGRGRDFPSNGAGKSTLFEAVYWVLFGRTTKGLTGDEVIRWGTDDCEVSAHFVFDGDWLHITRTRGTASRLLVETGAGGFMEAKSVTELTEKLGRYLGITPELYQALGYFSQERLLLFASATDGERKDMLADLIGLAAYQEAAAAATGQLMDLGAAAQKIVVLKDAAEARQTAEMQRLAGTAAHSEQWEADRKTREQAAFAASVHFEAALKSTRQDMLVEARARLGSTLTQREEAALARLGPAQEALSAFCAATNTQQELIDAQKEHSRVLSDVKSTRALMKENEQQLTSAKRRLAAQNEVLATGKCPSCGQEITAAHREKCLTPATEELRLLVDRTTELVQQLEPQQQLVLGWHARVGVVGAGIAAGEKRAQWAAILAETEKALADIERERTGVESNATWHVDKTLEDRRKELGRVVSAIQRERNPYDMETDATQQRIREAELDVLHHTEERIRVQEETAVYDYWRRGFSKQGIQSLLVDEVAGLFNMVRGTIFPALTQGVYDVQFSTLSQTKQGEWREKSEFQIYEHGQVVPYAALSGGQRRRVDVGVMLTLVKSVSKWMQVPGMLGVLVLDEVFGFLDGSGAEGLMEALREMQEQIPAIFVISHEPQLQALFPEIIVVEQDQDGVSHILAESTA